MWLTDCTSPPRYFEELCEQKRQAGRALLTWNELQSGLNAVNATVQEEHDRECCSVLCPEMCLIGPEMEFHSFLFTFRDPQYWADQPGPVPQRPSEDPGCAAAALQWPGGGTACQCQALPRRADPGQKTQSRGTAAQLNLGKWEGSPHPSLFYIGNT